MSTRACLAVVVPLAICCAAHGAPTAVVLAKSQSAIEGTGDLIPYSVQRPTIASDDTTAFQAEFGGEAGFALIIETPQGERIILNGAQPLPTHPDLYAVRGYFELFNNTVIAIAAATEAESSSVVARLVGRPNELRIVARQGERVPGTPEGWTWGTLDDATVRVRHNGSAVVLGRTRGPLNEFGYAVVESPVSGEAFLIARSGAPLTLALGVSRALASIQDIAVSDSSTALTVVLHSPPDSTRALYLIQDATAVPVVAGTQPVPEFGAMPMSNDSPRLFNMTRDGRLLVGVPLDDGFVFPSYGLLSAGPGAQRGLVAPPQSLFSVDGEFIVPRYGTINQAGDVAFLADLYPQGASSFNQRLGEVVMLAAANGTRTFIAGGGSTASTPDGQVQFDGFWSNAPQFNDRGQIVLEAYDALAGQARRDFVIARDPIGGWALLFGNRVAVPTVSGVSLCCTSPVGTTTEPWAVLSPSGRVIGTLVPGTEPNAHVIATIVPSPATADANADSICDGRDLSVLLSNFGDPVSPPGSGADFNADGVVNGADLSILLSAFGT